MRINRQKWLRFVIWPVRHRSIGRCGFETRLFPKPFCDFQWLDFKVLPPAHFVADLIQLPMMASAEGYGELVADFEADCPGLRKSQVMRIGRLPAADEARLIKVAGSR